MSDRLGREGAGVPRRPRVDPGGPRREPHRSRSCAPWRSRARWRTPPASAPTSAGRRSWSCWRPSTSAARLDKATEWAARGARRHRAEAPHPRRRHRGHGEEPAGVRAAAPARRDPQGARRDGEDGDEIARYRERIAETPMPEEALQGGRARAVGASRPAPPGPRARRSVPTSTGCSTSRGASTQRRAERRQRGATRFSRPTTPA